MYLSTSYIKYLWLIAAIFISGCATTSKQAPKPTNAFKPSKMHQLHMENIANIQQFELKGRMGVITNPKNFSARLAWQHNADSDNIDVYSPLGGKVANIVKTPDQVTFTDNKKKNISAQDTETLTEDTLGFRLPLSGLSYWALGKPNKQGIVNAMSWDENGRITTLNQNGWDIQYKNYASYGSYSLPKKITLKNEKITLKLIIDDWLGL